MLFPWYTKYPYQNDEVLNLDWVLHTIDNLVKEVSDFVSLNTIKYADPIQWNITNQYEKNTVVIDPLTGSAYISTKPVPAGVGLNNTDYWNIIFTLDVISANKNITLRDDANNMLATFESVVDDWLLWQGTLYIVTKDIDIGQAYVEDYNISRYTVEQFLKDYITNLKTVLENELAAATGDLDDLQTEDKINLVAAINEVLSTLSDKIGDLSDLTTTDKDNLVEALNELNSALGNISDSIGDLADLDTTDKDNAVEAINEVVGLLGNLSNLDTTDKTSLVAAINEVLDEVDDIDINKLELIYMQDYLDQGLTPTQALKAAISDCPAKGCIVIPRCKKLDITERIDIVKPLTIMGLDNGFNQIEGGNNFTPNSEYTKYSLRFYGSVDIGFNILSPSVEIRDLVIHFNTTGGFKAFALDNAAGDNLNMPRDIRLKNIVCLNEDTGYTNLTYGVYSDKTVLLSTFTDVLFGWVSRGFYFMNSNINTSLRFIRCGVTCSTTGFYLNKATYCYFIGCSVESPATASAFYFDNCKGITLLACFTEQVASASVYANTCIGVSIIGLFTTTLPIYSGFLGDVSIIACCSTTEGTGISPELLLNGVNAKLSGCRFAYVKQGNLTSHNVLNQKILNHHEGIAAAGYSITGATIVASSDFFNQIDKTCELGCKLNVTSTSVTINCPTALLPMYTKVIAGDGYYGIVNQGGTITLNFAATGTYNVDITYEAIASF